MKDIIDFIYVMVGIIIFLAMLIITFGVAGKHLEDEMKSDTKHTKD